ncbi:MAG: DNA-directed RNA polymerase [Candidatus Nanoarchaeia archaeon]|nr:DNA-directed RNA polymerase [Candidatus Nanoarchaeia archaeon]
MFYESELRSHVRVAPDVFQEDPKKAILSSLKERFEGFISKELGAVIAVSEITNIGEGVIIPGDGAAYYDTSFKLYIFKPELQEVLLTKINDITDFGAFMDMGAIDGMIHISQTMDDFVSFSKANVLTGKQSKKVLKSGDLCRARIIAVSFKDPKNPKIGLTMRQAALGNLKWIEEDLKKREKPTKQVKK